MSLRSLGAGPAPRTEALLLHYSVCKDRDEESHLTGAQPRSKGPVGEGGAGSEV